MPIAVCWQLRCLLTDGYYGFKMDLFAAGLTGWNSFFEDLEVEHSMNSEFWSWNILEHAQIIWTLNIIEGVIL